MDKGFSLVEVVIATAILCVLTAAVTSTMLAMIRGSEFGDNNVVCVAENRKINRYTVKWLKQARISTLTLSGTGQTTTIEVSKEPLTTDTVTVYPEVTFEVPVGFVVSAERTVWSGDADASTHCPSSHELFTYLPCKIRYKRDSVTGNVVQEYVNSSTSTVVFSKGISRCPQYSTLKDDSGTQLPGLAFYLYPNPPAENSVTILLTTSAGNKENPRNTWAEVSTQTKVIPMN